MTPATCCNMLAVCCTSLNACCTMLKGCCRMQTVCCKVLEMLYNGLIMRLFLLLTMTGVGVMLNEVETWFFVPHESLNEDSCVLVWASPLQETRPRQQAKSNFCVVRVRAMSARQRGRTRAFLFGRVPYRRLAQDNKIFVLLGHAL